MDRRHVQTTMTYIAGDPLYHVEKPYACMFPVDDIPGAVPSNHIFEQKQIVVKDVREANTHTLDSSGFTFIKAATALTLEEFDSYETVKDRYFPELQRLLLQLFPCYAQIVYMDHNHRKRDKAFPNSQGTATRYAQPLTLPHLDFSPDSAQQRLEQVISADGLEHLRSRPFDQLNVWRVLRGPNNDWPLAVCDFRTVDLDCDPLASDLLFRDTASENYTLKSNANHQWYYMSGQEVDDVLIFRNASSQGMDKPCAWHASFDARTSNVTGCLPRQSMDVRLFAFY